MQTINFQSGSLSSSARPGLNQDRIDELLYSASWALQKADTRLERDCIIEELESMLIGCGLTQAQRANLIEALRRDLKDE